MFPLYPSHSHLTHAHIEASSADIDSVCDALAHPNPSIYALSVTGIYITDLSSLSLTHTIFHLDCPVSEDSFARIGRALEANVPLRRLKLSQAGIKREWIAAHLVQGLVNTHHLESLDLGSFFLCFFWLFPCACACVVF